MPRRVTAVPLFDDLLSTLTNQPASFYDEFGYGFEHARPPDLRLSLLDVDRSITAQGRKAAGRDCEEAG
jgi:hypothetical protein